MMSTLNDNHFTVIGAGNIGRILLERLHGDQRWENQPAVGWSVADLDGVEITRTLEESIVFVPFNPTAENMAQYLVEVIGPLQLHATDVTLVKVVIEETRKCSCTFEKD